MSVYGETRRTLVAPVGEMVAALVLGAAGLAQRGFKAVGAVACTLERRRVLADLATFDDHMLKDIGLTRADLRDAASTPLGADPTWMLALRVTERRAANRLAARRPH